MRRFVLLIVCFFLWLMEGYSEETLKYAVASIPDELLENADFVIRNSTLKIDVRSNTDITIVQSIAFTILNDNAYKHAVLNEEYDNLVKINNIKGALYDKNGLLIKTMKLRDATDMGEYGYSFADDNRKKMYDFHYAQYPFTVEFFIEKKISSFFFVDKVSFVEDYKCSLQSASFEILYPSKLHISYQLKNLDVKVNDGILGEQKYFNFTVQGIKAVKKDKMAVVGSSPFPTILLAADVLEMGGVTGSMTSWKSFGSFFYELNKDRDNLDDDTKKRVHELTDTCKSDKQKTNILFNYLKDNTRYVSIQMGVGGWRTFDAKYVTQNGYGDCKALSNCMKALLKEAGITSYQALVFGGHEQAGKIDGDFPSNVFNHVILCVPGKSDTTWIECTSDDLYPGYLSEFTHNRRVLLICPGGGEVVKTPEYSYNENKVIRKVIVDVKRNGDITGKANFTRTGEFWVKDMRILRNGQKQDIEKMKNARISIPSHTVNSYSYESITTNTIPLLNETILFQGKAKMTVAGKRTFFDVVITDVNLPDRFAEEHRTAPFCISESYQVVDTIVYTFEDSLVLETLPSETHLTYKFGSFDSYLVFENNRILKYVRYYKQLSGEYNADMYTDYLKFIGTIMAKSSEQKAVFIWQ